MQYRYQSFLEDLNKVETATNTMNRLWWLRVYVLSESGLDRLTFISWQTLELDLPTLVTTSLVIPV